MSWTWSWTLKKTQQDGAGPLQWRRWSCDTTFTLSPPQRNSFQANCCGSCTARWTFVCGHGNFENTTGIRLWNFWSVKKRDQNIVTAGFIIHYKDTGNRIRWQHHQSFVQYWNNKWENSFTRRSSSKYEWNAEGEWELRHLEFKHSPRSCQTRLPRVQLRHRHQLNANKLQHQNNRTKL